MNLFLTRFAYLDQGTLGRIQIENGPLIYTLERPWLDNKPFISCIPEGDYALEWDTTGRIRNVPRLRGTEPRTQINIHIANYPEQLQGCIAPGLRWEIQGQSPSIARSSNAMELLLEVIGMYQSYQDGDIMVDVDGQPINLIITSANALSN